MSALKELGRIGLRAITYFEAASSLALGIGLLVVTIVEPGVGINIDQAALDPSAVATYTTAAKHLTAVDFVLNIIPNTFVDAFAKGEILPVLLLSVLSGLALLQIGERVRPLVSLIDLASQMLFQIVGMIMRLAPIGAFGATAFTIGRYGVGTLLALGKLMFSVYATCALFARRGGISSRTPASTRHLEIARGRRPWLLVTPSTLPTPSALKTSKPGSARW